MKKAILLAGAVVLLMATSRTFSQKATETGTNQLSSREAVGLIRSINTAELDLFLTKQSYAPLKAVLNHRLLQKGSLHPADINDTLATIKNYKLLLIDSSDGKHYTVSLINSKSGCQPAVFSSEAALIYMGKVIGCPAQ